MEVLFLFGGRNPIKITLEGGKSIQKLRSREEAIWLNMPPVKMYLNPHFLLFLPYAFLCEKSDTKRCP